MIACLLSSGFVGSESLGVVTTEGTITKILNKSSLLHLVYRMLDIHHHAHSFLPHPVTPNPLVGNLPDHFPGDSEDRSVQRHSSPLHLCHWSLHISQSLLDELPVEKAGELQDELAEPDDGEYEDACEYEPLPPVQVEILSVHAISQGVTQRQEALSDHQLLFSTHQTGFNINEANDAKS